MEKKRIIRYLFFGGCTTAVNLTAFWFLEEIAGLGVQMANLCSILAAIVFAFGVNRWFVFGRDTLDRIGMEFVRFVGMRGVTLAVELLGVDILAHVIPAFSAKMCLQIVVIVLNYLISKCYVFQEGGCTNEEN